MIRTNASPCATLTELNDEPIELTLLQNVTARLRKSPYLPLRSLVCRLEDEQLRIEGRVPTFHLKQVLWKTVREVVDLAEIIDRVEVVTPGTRRPG